jgi:hypothetical protein
VVIAIVITVVAGTLVALFMVLRQDWESVEVEAQLTRWGRFKLRLRRRLDRGGVGPTITHAVKPPDVAPAADVTRLARRGRPSARDPDRTSGPSR